MQMDEELKEASAEGAFEEVHKGRVSVYGCNQGLS